MGAKTKQLQIRVSRSEKATLQRLAKQAGMGVSAYVLSRVLPAGRTRFAEILELLVNEEEPRFALAGLHDFLSGLAPAELEGAASEPPPPHLSHYLKNYLAAMVELAAHQKAVVPPAWVREIEPLERPHFVVPLPGLRLHLLASSPVPFRRRNIFVDSAVGDRV